VSQELNSSLQQQLDDMHHEAIALFTGALEACNIPTAFDRRLRFEGHTLHRLMADEGSAHTIDLAGYKRIFVIAIGKAAGPMLETLLSRMKRRKGLRGICCTNQPPKERNWRFRYFHGGHPLPNEDSFNAARAALTLLRKARKDTLVFFLISGGGSAMFDLPLDSTISLEETVAFHEALLASGAPIVDINTLRKKFSAVKGGRLANAADEATKISLLLPDVPMHSLDALASGPTTPDYTTIEEAREIIERYALANKFPRSVRAFFEREDLPVTPGSKVWQMLARLQRTEVRVNKQPQSQIKSQPTPHPEPHPASTRESVAAAKLSNESPALRNSIYEVLLSSHDLLESARALAMKHGYYTVIDNSCDDWDYERAARYLMERLVELRKEHAQLCLLSGGEVTVTLGASRGAGGRNQQFVLACVDELAKHRAEAIKVFSAGSDGVDGNTEAAGAIADPTTKDRAQAFGFDPDKSLARFDACPLFTALGDSVVVGPTGHNLRDLRILLARASEK
jgi:hydroxypyruvate reductase